LPNGQLYKYKYEEIGNIYHYPIYKFAPPYQKTNYTVFVNNITANISAVTVNITFPSASATIENVYINTSSQITSLTSTLSNANPTGFVKINVTNASALMTFPENINYPIADIQFNWTNLTYAPPAAVPLSIVQTQTYWLGNASFPMEGDWHYFNTTMTGYFNASWIFTPNWTVNATAGPTGSYIQFNATPYLYNATINYYNWSYGDGYWYNGTDVTQINGSAHQYTIQGVFSPTLYLYNNSYKLASKTAPPTITISLAGLTRADINLTRTYNYTVYVRDSSTHALIPDSGIVLSGSTTGTYTSTTGSFDIYASYGLLTIDASAEGYYANQKIVLVDEDGSTTVYLTETAPVSNIDYTPWQVRFQIVDYYQNPLPGTNVTASYIASTLPSTDISWLVNAFGISSTVAAEMVDSGYAMGGQTDDNGGISFTMFKSIAYNLSIINSTSGVNVAKILYPTDQEYRIRVPLSSQVAPNNSLEQRSGTKLPVYQLNASCYNLSVVYSDTSGLTTNVVMEVIAVPNRTRVYTYNFGNPNVATVVHNYTVCHQAIGSELRWQYSATRSGT
jgi:hypothetical protein